MGAGLPGVESKMLVIHAVKSRKCTVVLIKLMCRFRYL